MPLEHDIVTFSAGTKNALSQDDSSLSCPHHETCPSKFSNGRKINTTHFQVGVVLLRFLALEQAPLFTLSLFFASDFDSQQRSERGHACNSVRG